MKLEGDKVVDHIGTVLAEKIATNIRAGGAYATPHCHKIEGNSA